MNALLKNDLPDKKIALAEMRSHCTFALKEHSYNLHIQNQIRREKLTWFEVDVEIVLCEKQIKVSQRRLILSIF